VDHHDDVRPFFQGYGVAGLLIGAIPLIEGVAYDGGVKMAAISTVASEL